MFAEKLYAHHCKTVLAYLIVIFTLQHIGVEEVCKRLNEMILEAKSKANIPATTKLNSLVRPGHLLLLVLQHSS